MRHMVVPPPMSAYQLPLPAPAAQVVSSAWPAESTGDVGVLTADNQFLVFCSGNQSETFCCFLYEFILMNILNCLLSINKAHLLIF